MTAKMIGLMQRVSTAYVDVEGERIAEIGRGLLVLIGVERLLSYRVFADAEDKMNLSLRDIQGGLLLVPQFTLAADTQKGSRPSFSSAAPPDEGRRLFEYIVARAQENHAVVETGRFGADMQVGLVNEGPVTFHLHVKADKAV
jgi:D-tyrosyl-tRNA(Tyr) deacylase